MSLRDGNAQGKASILDFQSLLALKEIVQTIDGHKKKVDK
jgi:hypothetical protein